MDSAKIINYFQNSFLKEFLKDEEITDISYNGTDFCYLHNLYGRRKVTLPVEQNEVNDFVRQIANMTQKQFSFTTPILDVSFGKYRFNAIHPSIGRVENEEAITFSVRIASKHLHITSNCDFFPKPVSQLIDVLVNSHKSIVIGGLTGSGKTELQKYIINRIEDCARLVIIDNVLELDFDRKNNPLDINVWQVDERNEFSSIQSLVRNALRSNPDWLIVAESRGSEMIEVLNSAMTGHPIITTLHAMDVSSIPHRMARMVMMNDKKMSFEDVLGDIYYHFNFYIFVERKIDPFHGVVERFVSSVTLFKPDGSKVMLYEKHGDGDDIYNPIPEDILKSLKIPQEFYEFKKVFVLERSEV